MDPTNDPDYQRFVSEMAKFCRCTTDVVCGGVLAGGPCDDLHYNDDEDEDDFPDDDEPHYTAQIDPEDYF